MKCIKLFIPLYISITFLALMNLTHAASKDKDLAISTESYNWTGYYAGLNAGAVKHTMNITDNQAVTFNATIQQETDLSFTGGLQIGYRRQLNPSPFSGVFGLELSTNFADAESTKQYGSPFALYQLTSTHELENLTLVQFIGGIAADRTFLFLAAGLSWTDISGNVTNKDGIPFFNTFSVSKNQVNAALGCGAEYAFNNKLSARIKVDVIIPDEYTTQDNAGNKYDVTNNIVQGTIGVNYRFA